MIRRRCPHKPSRTYCDKKGSSLTRYRETPVSLTSPQLAFCDTALVATSHPRFIGTGDTGLIADSLEEAFLSVTKVIDHMTVVVKRPSTSFDSIAFDLIRVPCPNGEVHLTGNSLITSIVVPGTNITSSETAFYRSESFPVTVLNEGPHCGSGRINWNFTSQLLRRSNNFLAFHPIG